MSGIMRSPVLNVNFREPFLGQGYGITKTDLWLGAHPFMSRPGAKIAEEDSLGPSFANLQGRVR